MIARGDLHDGYQRDPALDDPYTWPIETSDLHMVALVAHIEGCVAIYRWQDDREDRIT